MSSSNIMQYFLAEGSVSGLNTIILVIPSSDLMRAKRFQQPNLFFSLVVSGVITAFVSIY